VFDDLYYSADYLTRNWWEKWGGAVKVGLSAVSALVLFFGLVGGALFVHNQNAPSRNGLLIDSLGREISGLRLDMTVSDAQTARQLMEQLGRLGLKLVVSDSLGVARPLLYISRGRTAENGGQK
jgi:hypothetical protein